MSNSNGYLSRNLLNELDKEEKEKTTTQIVDNWQKLTASQRTAKRRTAKRSTRRIPRHGRQGGQKEALRINRLKRIIWGRTTRKAC